MTDKTDLIREIHEYVTTHGGENTATHLLVQAASAIQTQAAELEAVGAGGVQALSAAPAGWKLVLPVEPTVDQEWAGKNAALRCSTMGEACKIYKAMLAASPTPPAEQQAEESLTKLLAECRDAFPIPEPSSPLEVQWAAAMARPEEVPEYVRLCVAEMQAAPKAAPGEQNAVSAEWLEQAYREGWAACRDAETIGEEAEDWAFGNSTANSRMIDAQQAAPQQEAQEPALFVSAKQLAALTDPDDPDGEHGRYLPVRKTTKGLFTQALYTAPQPAPAPLGDDVVKDAARYRWLRDEGFTFADVDLGTDSDGDDFVAYRIRFHLPEPAHSKFEDDEWAGPDIDAAIDAAIAAQGGK